MARRRQLRIDPSVFLQQQGGGDEASQLAMAMEMLGFGKGQEGQRGELQLGREKLQAETQRYGRGQDIEEQKLAAENKRAAEQEAFNNWVKEQTLKGQEEERKYRAGQLLSEAQKSRDVFNAKAYELASAEERPALLAAMSKEGKEGLLQLEILKQNKLAGDVLRNVQGAYKSGNKGQIETALAGVPQEILQRPEFEWQKWNQGLAEAPKSITGGNRGLLGLLWNTPAALQNVGKGIANVGSGAVLGEGAPQVEYTKYTDPVQKLQERAAGMPEGPVVSEAPLRKLLAPSNILGLDRRKLGIGGPTVQELMQAVAPSKEYAPGIGVIPPDMDMFTRLKALQ